jgi:hypothetical protein
MWMPHFLTRHKTDTIYVYAKRERSYVVVVKALVDEAGEEVVGLDDAWLPYGAEPGPRREHGRISVDVHRLELVLQRSGLGHVAIHDGRPGGGLAQIGTVALLLLAATAASIVVVATTAPAAAFLLVAANASTTSAPVTTALVVAASTSASAMTFLLVATIALAAAAPITTTLVAAGSTSASMLVAAATAAIEATTVTAAIEATTTTAPAAATTTSSAVIAVVLRASATTSSAVVAAPAALSDVRVHLTPAATTNPASSTVMARHETCSRPCEKEQQVCHTQVRV